MSDKTTTKKKQTERITVRLTPELRGKINGHIETHPGEYKSEGDAVKHLIQKGLKAAA